MKKFFSRHRVINNSYDHGAVHRNFDKDRHHIFANVQQLACWQLQSTLFATTSQLAPILAIDIGCGTGNMLVAVTKFVNCQKMYGVDLSAAMLSLAKKNYPASTPFAIVPKI